MKKNNIVILSLVILLYLPAISFAEYSLPNEALSPPIKVQISDYASTEKSERNLFTTDFIIPLYYPKDKDTLVFFNPKYTYIKPAADEFNYGLGLRQIFDDSLILGINTFFDRRFSISKKWYSQAGLGLECLSYPFDARINWYKPLTGSKLVDTTYQFGSTSLIKVDSKEEPLQGIDFEFGAPVFDKHTKTRLYVGGFFYQSKLSNGFNGFRARTETALSDWFSLDTIFNSKNDGQTEFIAGARVILPFEFALPHRWSTLFKSKQEHRAQAAHNSYLEDRIFDRIVRDIDVQTKSTTQQNNVSGIDMIYVDNSKASGGDGTLEHPYNTLQGAFNSGRYTTGEYIYVFSGDGSNTGYNSSSGYTLADNVVLWGSHYNGGYVGIPVTTGYPMIGGKLGTTIANPIITLANNNTVQGLDIEYGTNGIYGLSKNGSMIKNNNIKNNSSQSVYLNFTDSANHSAFTFSGNTISGNTLQGIYVRNSGAATISDFTFSGNTISGNSSYGIFVRNYSGTVSGFTFSSNTISGNSRYGINVRNNSSAISNVTFTNNTITGNSLSGIYATNFSGGGTFSGFTFTGNTITSNARYGIWAENRATGTLSDFTFTGNAITGNTRDGMLVSNSSTGITSGLTFTNNTITGHTRNGVWLNRTAGTMSSVNLGDGSTGGNNSIYSNGDGVTYFDVKNSSGVNNLSAQYNWWGQAGGPLSSKIGGTNTVDSSNPLSSNPN